jgi:hypothetical protein
MLGQAPLLHRAERFSSLFLNLPVGEWRWLAGDGVLAFPKRRHLD